MSKAETHPPIRCARCAVEIKDRHDEGARVRLGMLFGRRLSILWRQDAPWRYIDLCISCARAFDDWVEAGPVPERSRAADDGPSPLSRRVRAKAEVTGEGGWLYPLDNGGG
jgi:hypothetical protein